jgi:hypothetical protein
MMPSMKSVLIPAVAFACLAGSAAIVAFVGS